MHNNHRTDIKTSPNKNSPTFGKLEASGACSIKSGNRLSSAEGIWVDMSGASHSQLDVKAPSVHVDLSGACSATLQGETRDLQIDGTVDAFGLLAENTEVQLSGAGNADVYASKSLTAEASGAANIRYRGKPTSNVYERASGAGSIKKVE